MKERVKTIIGNKPVIIIAPHGANDTNTAYLAESAATRIGAYAVINQGFTRADMVDVDADMADCNKISHCQQDLVYEEFFKPIVKFKTAIDKKSELYGSNSKQDWTTTHIFYIHGCGDLVSKQVNEQVGVILGCGLGIKKDSLTCDSWRKNLFIALWNRAIEPKAFVGQGGGHYAGRDSDNLVQYFRKHVNDDVVQAMQLEFPFCFRKTSVDATHCGTLLGNIIGKYLSFKSYDLEAEYGLI
jgi:hypothetical protein